MRLGGAIGIIILALWPGGPGARAQSATAQTAPQNTAANNATDSWAAQNATLIADQVALKGDDVLLAEGNVEVFFQDTRLRATRVEYDGKADLLKVDGPITLTTPDGVILLADSAHLAPDLSAGLIRSARLVLDQQLQLAAARLYRVEGRYSVLDKTVASSCQVCAKQPVPLWQIRARRIVHDQVERQLYFEHARFEVAGLPVFYLPRLRLPDPTLERATGFLAPSIRATNALGTGLKLPYFITLGDHADLTVTPYYSSARSRTLELRYRQAFRHGEIEFNGAVSRDDIRQDRTRAYLFGQGRFDLPRDFVLRFNIETTNDDAYLLDYGYSNKDRLKNELSLARTRRDEFVRARLIRLKSLRDSESDETLPTTIVGSDYTRRFAPPVLGGLATVSFQTLGYTRRSDQDRIGRDVARATLELGWYRDWVARNGMVLEARSALNADLYKIYDDPDHDTTITRTTPAGSVMLRWPHAKTTATGVTHVIEPMAQLLWSDDSGEDVPNEDSLSPELDEGNLFSFNRFPGADAYETGWRANIGATWTRYDPNGWSLSLAAGRVLRAEDRGEFPAGTGLEGSSSDWLAAIRLMTAGNLSLTNRALFDDTFAFTADELRLDWVRDNFGLSSTYIWQEANLLEQRRDDTSEWVFGGFYRFHPNWTGKARWRYDFSSQRTQRAALGLQYENECIRVDMSVSRRFTSSDSVRPTTDVGLTVSLSGFGNASAGAPARRRCVQ